MDLIAGRPLAERIEVLKLIKQQLSAKARLAAVLQQGSDRKPEKLQQPRLNDDLREAIEQACSDAKLSLSDKTFSRLDAVSLELKTLEERKEKQKEIIEVGKQCKSLAEAIKKAQEYVADELNVDSSSNKRDRTSADLDKLGEEAFNIFRACKKLKGEDIGTGNSGGNAYSPGPFTGLLKTTPSICSAPPVPSIFPTPSPDFFGNRFPTTTTPSSSNQFTAPSTAPPEPCFNFSRSTAPATAPSRTFGSGFFDFPPSTTPSTAPRSSSKGFDPSKFSATVEDEVPEKSCTGR